MELATTYSYDLSKNTSVYLYAGLPGEPALGPSAFMHRTSGMDIPEAPITHHWLDSTHITFGVVTAGLVLNTWKLEASAFKGREPDQYRYDIEAPKLDSYSARISWNPNSRIEFPGFMGTSQIAGAVGARQERRPVHGIGDLHATIRQDNIWSTTLAWGRKMTKPGDTLDGFILETAAIFQKKYTLFARAERVQENELLDLEPAPVFTVNKLTVGGIYDFFPHRSRQVRRWRPCEFLRCAGRFEAGLWRSDERNGLREVEDRMTKLPLLSVFAISAVLRRPGPRRTRARNRRRARTHGVDDGYGAALARDKQAPSRQQGSWTRLPAMPAQFMKWQARSRPNSHPAVRNRRRLRSR